MKWQRGEQGDDGGDSKLLCCFHSSLRSVRARWSGELSQMVSVETPGCAVGSERVLFALGRSDEASFLDALDLGHAAIVDGDLD